MIRIKAKERDLLILDLDYHKFPGQMAQLSDDYPIRVSDESNWFVIH